MASRRAPHVVAAGNRDANWNGLGWDDYLTRNYKELSVADTFCANQAIGRVASLGKFGVHGSLLEIGSCGALRIPALLAPLLRPDAAVDLTDIGERQLELTRASVRMVLSDGGANIWASHQESMTKRDARWAGAFGTIAARARVSKQDLWELKQAAADLMCEGYVLESTAHKREEYEAGVDAFYGALRPGGVALRLFMINSTGYRVGDEFLPATKITPKSVEEEAERHGMIVVGGAFGVTDERAHLTARDVDDPTSYDGFGGAVLLKPDHAPSVIL